MYLVNGAGNMRVVEWDGVSAFTIQDAGVIAPTTTPSVAQAAGNPALPTFSLGFAISNIDPRGFESNLSPVGSLSGIQDGATITLTTLQAAPAGFTRKLYGTLRDGTDHFFIKDLDQSTANTSTTTLDGDRRTRFAAPDGHDVPPAGIFALFHYRGRLYGARKTGQQSSYFFSNVDEPEYWTDGDGQDLSTLGDGSEVMGFDECSAGLLILKRKQVLILRGDPELEDFPTPLIKGRGLIHPDAKFSVDGMTFFQSQSGLLATDGTNIHEINRRVSDASDEMISLDGASGMVHGDKAGLFYHEPNEATFIKAVHYEMERKIFMFDKYSTAQADAAVADASLDFSQEADVAEHENVENGAQAIATGGGTTSITLSGANSSKLKIGCIIKFVGTATVYTIDNISGATLTLNANAPAGTPAVEYIRGSKIDSGLLRMSSSGGTSTVDYRSAIMGLSGGTVTSWWRLGESDASPTFADEMAVSNLSRNGTVYASAIGLLTGDSNGNQAFPDTAAVGYLASSSTAYNASSNFSFGCWFVFDGVGTTATLMSRHTGTDGWSLQRDTIGGAPVAFIMNTAPNPAVILEGPALVNSVTNFYVCTYDGTTMRLYVNGALHASVGNGAPPPLTVADLVIGNLSSVLDITHEWANRIDEPFYVNRVLTAPEIAALYTAGTTAPVPGVPGSTPADTYLAKCLAKTSFPGFTAFHATAPVQIVSTEPSGSKSRFAFVFVSGGMPKVFSGGSWVDLSGVPTMADNFNSMSKDDVNALTAANMVAGGGFDTLVPYFQPYVYLASSSGNPSVDTITIQYLSGTNTIQDTLDVSTTIDIGGGATVPEGYYIWSSAGGYRLNDGITDDGNDINALHEIQEMTLDNAESDLLGIEVDYTVSTPVAYMWVEGKTDGVYSSKVGVPLKMGSGTVPIGINKHGFAHSARVTWNDIGLKVHAVHLILEPRGRGVAS